MSFEDSNSPPPKPQPQFALGRPAGFWIRAVALLIDGMLFMPVNLLAAAALFYLHSFPLWLLAQVPGLIYKPLTEACYGGTLGKQLLQLKVVDSEGQRIGLSAAYARFLPQLCSTLVECFTMYWLLSVDEFKQTTDFVEIAQLLQHNPLATLRGMLVWAYLGDCLGAAYGFRKRTLHDMIAGTCVVYK